MKPGYVLLLWLRSLVFWVWQVLNTLIMGIPVIVASAFSFDAGYRFGFLWIAGNLLGLRYICGVRWDIDGRENIPDEPCLILCKHQSTWETYFIPTVCYPAVFVAKKSLASIPLFGWSLRALDFILIDRSAGKSAIQQMIEQTREKLAQGRWVVVFPEGTRRPLDAPPSYRIGGAVVAQKVPTDVLPVAINAGEYWPRLGFIKWPGTIRMSFGPVIRSEGRSPEAILDETREWIETRTAEISDPDAPVRRFERETAGTWLRFLR
ncbi:MAG: 1-acyl-sn-glycerol-3-phosphate acyltransferase [Gammaproteobacteria bacterium]|nr:MAG: 1-acyl-sn-glycerol-3-phosphate acyltransferase [Gammaproteobacteria bacterium]PIE37788.1 MAG: 1-acyl-sn-glycerol-3-phosphate acyltransferase [Gammaproteobacteria bacterium]